MLIRKTQQPSDFPENQIHDAYSTSTTDTYSCNYINNNLEKPFAKIGLTTSQAITVNDYSKINFNYTFKAETGLSLVNNGIKVTNPGKYMVVLRARLTSSSGILAIRINNSADNEALCSASALSTDSLNTSAILDLNANDIIFGYVYSSKAGNIFGGGNPPVWVSMDVMKL